MAILTWFTQPENSYSSFYWYDTDTMKFVRIRLELGRVPTKTDNGRPVIFIRETRYVGFSKDLNLEIQNHQKWSIEKGKLAYERKSLASYPNKDEDDYCVYDTSRFINDLDSESISVSKNDVHKGNHLTNCPILPKGIDGDKLKVIAEHYLFAFLNKGGDCLIDIGGKNNAEVNEKVLTNGLISLYEKAIKISKDNSCCRIV